jgi:hypothetical protein
MDSKNSKKRRCVSSPISNRQNATSDTECEQGPATTTLDPGDAQQIDPEGDVILFMPGYCIKNKKIISSGTEAQFLVSSKHLKLASPYFKSLFADRWSKGTRLRTNEMAQIPIKDFKPETLLVLLNVVHGHDRKVPRSVSFQQLVELTLAIDFFQCNEAVEIFAAMWINSLRSSVPSEWSPDTKKWIMIASVFKDHTIFAITTKSAIVAGTCDFTTEGLPIPAFVPGKSIKPTSYHCSKVN